MQPSLSLPDALRDTADTVVMLTWSNWFTELRSNRYHYATRFARHIPVIFVQPDLEKRTYHFETTNLSHLTILHIYKTYDSEQTALLNKALLEAGCIQPIFWIYNCYFHHFLLNRNAVLKVYHATEDYLASESRIQFKQPALIEAYLNTLRQCELIIAVSDGVEASLRSHIRDISARITTVHNGCDYAFFSPLLNSPLPSKEKIVFYQGNIFDKIDYNLLLDLTSAMPDWTFMFCGKVLFNEESWQRLCKQPNVHYLGLLTPEEVRTRSYQATVGIIPFMKTEWLVQRSFPLKTFEYLAAGLPVVSIPIDAIMGFSDVILFANTVDEFKIAIETAGKLRNDKAHTQRRLDAASQQDYDIKFRDALSFIDTTITAKKPSTDRLKLAILYEPSSIIINTIDEHLNSFGTYSRHDVAYLPATQHIPCTVDLNIFDAIIIHYCVRVTVEKGSLMLSSDYIDAVQHFGGHKILFLQDEYEGTEIARSWINTLGIHTVYTCVPSHFQEIIYPSKRFPHTKFINTLTGYVPSMKRTFFHLQKTSQRAITIGYRGRALPYWYGSLGQEKLLIGVKVKAFCLKQAIPVDIEWEDSKRIYGDAWYHFMGSCRATLGTESGANIFDYDGAIRQAIEEKIQKNPSLTYDDIYDELIAPNEIIQMNQISPKLFEAIVFKTALILFEGRYSDVLIPNVHYIVLKKDFSNMEEVMSKVNDDTLIDTMTNRVYEDIIVSQRYSYATFINAFDDTLSINIAPKTVKPTIIEFRHFTKQVPDTLLYSAYGATSIPLTLEALQHCEKKSLISFKLSLIKVKYALLAEIKRIIPIPIKKILKKLRGNKVCVES